MLIHIANIILFTGLLSISSATPALADQISCSDERVVAATISFLKTKYRFPETISIHNIRSSRDAAQYGRNSCEAELTGDLLQDDIELVRYTAGLTDDTHQIYVDVKPAFDITPELQVVSCDSDGQLGYHAGPKYAQVKPSIPQWASRYLTYYTTGSLGVLAPRGWQCNGSYGSSGEGMIVAEHTRTSNKPIDIGVHISHYNAETSGRFRVAQVAARVFPIANNFVTGVVKEGISPASEFITGPFEGDTVEHKNEYTINFTTRPNAKGIGTEFGYFKESDLPISGTAMLVSDGLILVSTRLPKELQQLTDIIIGEAYWEYKDKLDYAGELTAIPTPISLPTQHDSQNSDETKGIASDQSLSRALKDKKLDDGIVTKWNQQGEVVAMRLNWTMLGLWPQTDIRIQIKKVMKASVLLQGAFPEIKNIKATVNAALKPRVDEFGNVIEANRYAQMISLNISASKLKNFPSSFDWDAYPVYAASKFVTNVDNSIKGAWDAEFMDEKRAGNFP